ncbi:MAG: family 16 glycosylhydrolase [Bacteroidota bacterium]
MSFSHCLLILLIVLLFHADVPAQLPSPPEGMQWELQVDYSDEFNGLNLDSTKWMNHHPYWVGRPPAIFLPSQVSVQNGYLQIQNKKLEQDSIYIDRKGDSLTYSIAGGAVVSKMQNAWYGYYSCRMKASRVSMSSTFWMKNRPFGECSKSVTELDIIEAIGGAKTYPDFATHMKSNTHIFSYPCEGEKTTFSEGNNAPIGGHVADDFHTYGAWWKNPNEILFYIDGVYQFTIHPAQDISETPFDRPMWINMVTETYFWEIPPTAEELADHSRNTTYYDWVRSYQLVPITPEKTSKGN